MSRSSRAHGKLGKWSKVLLSTLIVLIAGYLALCLIVFLNQRKYIYHPRRISTEVAESLAREQGMEPWKNDAGQVIGWKQTAPTNSPHERLLILHGNAGSALDRCHYGASLKKILPLDVYVLEYPGYGNRGGAPSQQSLFAAADEAMKLLKAQGPVYVMGESLGTGVACYLAANYPHDVKGILLLAPYDNLVNVGQVHMPIFPVSLLMLDRFPSATFLKQYHGPIAMLFAGHDVIVPNRFGHSLYDGYDGPKRFWEIATAGHNDLLEQPEAWWHELVSFWNTNQQTATTASKAKAN